MTSVALKLILITDTYGYKFPLVLVNTAIISHGKQSASTVLSPEASNAII